jgi:hypothetical protein
VRNSSFSRRSFAARTRRAAITVSLDASDARSRGGRLGRVVGPCCVRRWMIWRLMSSCAYVVLGDSPAHGRRIGASSASIVNGNNPRSQGRRAAFHGGHKVAGKGSDPTSAGRECADVRHYAPTSASDASPLGIAFVRHTTPPVRRQASIPVRAVCAWKASLPSGGSPDARIGSV